MTENEAIKAIQNDLEWHSKELKPTYKQCLRLAIEALEEVEQYRAIGTVEDIEKGIKQSEEEFNMLMEYRAIGTIDEFKDLKEKNVAKKAHRNYEHFNGCWCECGWFVGSSKSVDRPNYCPDCGQKLDWSERREQI